MATRQVSIYEDKETGDINELRDNKLAKLGISDPNANVSATDYVELMTSTGEPIKVTQQSLAAALGSIFAASDPKTFTKLLGMNSGSPMGIGPSDLASVLGVISNAKVTYIKYSDQSFADPPVGIAYGVLRRTGHYYLCLSIRDNNGEKCFQIAMSNSDNCLYSRWSYFGSFNDIESGWSKVGTQ